MEYFFYNFSRGVDVYNSLNELHRHHNSTSFLISAVGDLAAVSFKCPLKNKPVIFKKNLEIITLSGYIRSTESHLHISASDENCSVFGGHLLSGTIVLKSLDVLIGVIPNLNKTLIRTLRDIPSTVDIYILSDCPWSKRALILLDSLNVKYNSHVITNDEEFTKISNVTSISTFPQIFINNKFIGGYSELSDLAAKGDLMDLIS
ncbi:PCC domain-containing protein [Prochlorococcus sp. MIT 0916]|uniref:PCC domain-containing protein n=1 Tax=Prochlorococcus sp. MIT 0916 TaxID=3082521 RepID=UPI0039B3B7CD